MEECSYASELIDIFVEYIKEIVEIDTRSFRTAIDESFFNEHLKDLHHIKEQHERKRLRINGETKLIKTVWIQLKFLTRKVIKTQCWITSMLDTKVNMLSYGIAEKMVGIMFNTLVRLAEAITEITNTTPFAMLFERPANHSKNYKDEKVELNNLEQEKKWLKQLENMLQKVWPGISKRKIVEYSNNIGFFESGTKVMYRDSKQLCIMFGPAVVKANSYNKRVDNYNLYDPEFPSELIAKNVPPSHLKLVHIPEIYFKIMILILKQFDQLPENIQEAWIKSAQKVLEFN
eukprot:gene9792-2117_t